MTNLKLIGGGYQRARKQHTCWTCGESIEPGEGYFRTVGTVDAHIFSVKHCRKTCECTWEMLDQNPHLAAFVFQPVMVRIGLIA